eukprot:gb/GECG01001187.1/.p1 GENE.gb/GECG01001187.1/~~gb/GECG01001187.1/.p1  ORF type:complete len:721 (+),score=64.65 gb/GECG01001187.1/:1-2163(+)
MLAVRSRSAAAAAAKRLQRGTHKSVNWLYDGGGRSSWSLSPRLFKPESCAACALGMAPRREFATSNEARDQSPKIAPSTHTQQGAHIDSVDLYEALYEESVQNPEEFWAKQATTHLDWFRAFDSNRTKEGSLEEGGIRWFNGGQLNVCHNCVDRHIPTKGDQVAIIHEGDEPGNVVKYTYRDVLREVSKVANVMKAYGVKKGDTVAIYMPMVPQLVFTMLACARIGAVHSVVFAGFSSDSLRDRIVDGHSKYVFTCDEGTRGGKTIPVKHTTDTAVSQCHFVENVFVYKHTGTSHVDYHSHDVIMDEELPKARPYCPPVTLDAEDPLFLLYTSGSTGQPKGLQHSQAGYLLHAMLTHKHVFDYRENDVYACLADCGWITGHSYVLYGPLANGATTVMFEGTPLYPHNGRYWEIIRDHGVNQLYTSPTAIRALMKYGTGPLEGYDLSSLRVLGTVGEPINPEAWRWFYENVGKGRCSVVDTFWQTETGGIMITPLPGTTPMKPGSACFPYFGVDPVLLDKDTGAEKTGNGVEGVLCFKQDWPGMARTVFGDHERFLNTYLRPYPGYYFTGDGAYRDQDGYIWITGRVDDVLNVSGHRLGSAEIESCLVGQGDVAEAAVVGFPHDTKGEGICCYVTLKEHVQESEDLLQDLRMTVRHSIGPLATPDYVIITSALPKTRSGKIMRRLLRKVIAGETDQLGDTSTLADSDVVEELIQKASKQRK